jgi:hypothetical protein
MPLDGVIDTTKCLVCMYTPHGAAWPPSEKTLYKLMKTIGNPTLLLGVVHVIP